MIQPRRAQRASRIGKMYQRFGLTLAVTHACNLRCSYCYTGRKFTRSMSEQLGCAAIDRAVASLENGGTLELGFFGGEPLLQAALIERLIRYARMRGSSRRIRVELSLTTNGTITDPAAWRIMMRPDLDLAVSFDGVPEIHDRHRRTATGHDSSERVLATIRRLVAMHQPFRVVLVVRPDTVESLPAGIAFLHESGVNAVEPSLDLWTPWTIEDVGRLEKTVLDCARFWHDNLPNLSVSWFDEKAASLAGIFGSPCARCGFGDGEIAVAPSGRLYPCERLIGEDEEGSPIALAGHVLDGTDFLNLNRPPHRADSACGDCAAESLCNTTCRCSNYVRTGDIRRPDGLLCRWNQACLRATAQVLSEPAGCAS